MDFLSKVKTNTAEVKPNPFAKQSIVLNKKPETESSGEKKKLLFPAKKENIISEAQPMTPKKIVLTEEVIQESQEEITESTVQSTEDNLGTVEETVENTTDSSEIVTEESTIEEKTESKESDSSNTESLPEETMLETIAEEIKEEIEEKEEVTIKPKKRNSKKKNTEPKIIESTEIGSPSLQKELKDSDYLSYEDAITALRSEYYNEDWESLKEEISSDLEGIKISADMNPSILKQTIADLSNIRQKIWIPYQETKTLYYQLSNKEPEGLIEQVKRTAFGEEERNDMERKRAGVLACIQYTPPGAEGYINLYRLLDATMDKYNFLKGAIELIQYKTNILITMNGAIKLETQLLNGEM